MASDLSLQRLTCTHCGAPIDLRSGRAKTVVCSSCHSQLDLTKPEHAVLGNLGQSKAFPASLIRLGHKASFDELQWMVIGRIRYKDDEGYRWDEWLLLSEQGKYRWLAEDRFHYYFYDLKRPGTPIDPQSKIHGDSVELDGASYQVYEKGQASIDYVEGELTWKAVLGSKVRFLDAAGPPRKLSIEWNEDEIQVYEGPYLSAEAVYEAFGFASPPPEPPDVSPCQSYDLSSLSEFAIYAGLVGAFLAFMSLMLLTGGGERVWEGRFTLAELKARAVSPVIPFAAGGTCRAVFFSQIRDGWGWIGVDMKDAAGKTVLSFSEQLQNSSRYAERRLGGEVRFPLKRGGDYTLHFEADHDEKAKGEYIGIRLYRGMVGGDYFVLYLLACMFFPLWKGLDYLWFLSRRKAAMMAELD